MAKYSLLKMDIMSKIEIGIKWLKKEKILLLCLLM